MMMRKSYSFAAILILLVGILTEISLAEFYRYTTKEGQVHYVDDISLVPEEYRDQIKVYTEQTDYLSEHEKQRLREIENAQEQDALAAQQGMGAEEQGEVELETRVLIVSNQVLVPVIIGYGYQEYETTLLLDTGASSIVLHTAFANAANIGARRRNLSRVAGGGIIHSEKAEIDYLKIGPYKFDDLKITIIDHTGPPVDYNGLLGMNVLRHTRYNIDFENSVIRWQP